MLSKLDQFCSFWDQFCRFAYLIRLGDRRDHLCGRTSDLSRSLLNLKCHQKLWTTIWKHEWNFCEDKWRPWKTADNWVTGIDSKSTSATVNDIERLPTTLSFYLCYMKTNKISLATANDPDRLPTTGSE